MAQYNDDARLMAEFEKTGKHGKSIFNYSRAVSQTPTQEVSTQEQINAYLSRIQRGGMVQPFGCLLAFDGPSFRIIAYSENCFDMLGLKGELKRDLIGVDARTLFTSSSQASLVKAATVKEISFLNPIWVRSRTNQKPFYAILHRIDVGIVADFEPAYSNDPALLCAGAVQSQKLAVRVISRLQALPGGDIGVLCDTLVENVQKLTGYDRVMVYKFHDDNHGEVVSEIRKSGLEPYLGLHYPATDIPQAARFLFKQNRVRIICDCNAGSVKIIQSEELKQPLCLVNSTLRAPHGCHNQYMANMGSIASFVMSVVINNGDSMKLWGLVVCHHTSPRYVPFPLRYACEFLMQAFGLQLFMELQLASQLAEKKVLQMQTLLCDMLLRDSPSAIVTQSPNIMDLVKCDGAALYHRGKCWLLGITPTEVQLREIIEWLLENYAESTGFSTDSLAEAGYPGAALLGDAVCGMAAARISSSNYLFWFRSHAAKEIKWGGAKHHPEDRDDGGRMNPRSSFNAFLEVVKSRSQPWEVAEVNAIHSLQLILRDSFEASETGPKPMNIDFPEYDDSKMKELSSAAVEMVRLIETASAPIFGVDQSGMINGWNAKMCELTGLEASEAIGKSLTVDVVHKGSREVVKSILDRALQGEEDKNVEVRLLNFAAHDEQNAAIYLLVSACTSRDYRNCIVGVCFVGQDVTYEKKVMDKFIRLEQDYKAIIQSLNPLIPPIFASDENACCSEWSASMEKLTGWMRHEIIGKVLPGEVFGSFCQLKGRDELTKFMILLYRAIGGQETEKLSFGFFNRKAEYVDVFLTASKRADQGGKVIGCFCFLQTVEIYQPQNNQEETENYLKLKELAYIRHEMKNPLSGIRFTHQLLSGSSVTAYQRQFLETSDACEKQILSVINDTDFGSLETGGKMELNMEEFLLGNVVSAIVSQAMILLNEKNLRLVHDIPEQMKNLSLYGDQMKLQSSLSSFLLTIVKHTPPSDGWVEINISPGLKLIQDGYEQVRVEFRMTHPGQGLPSAIIDDMFGAKNNTTEDGTILNLSQNLLNMMNGNVRYNREQNKCYFLIDLELKSRKSTQSIVLA